MQLINLNTNFIGKNSYYYEKIDSTQSEIWRLYEKDAPSGTLVMANIQTNAHGTKGRIWYTDEENNIAFSFLIRMDCNIKKLDGLTLEIAQIIINIFKEVYNIEIFIKEPNDIVYKNKKIGGILTQTKIKGENVKALVVGIGINTSKTKFNKEIIDIATSIKKEFNIDINIEQFIEEFCIRFEKSILERINLK